MCRTARVVFCGEDALRLPRRIRDKNPRPSTFRKMTKRPHPHTPKVGHPERREKRPPGCEAAATKAGPRQRRAQLAFDAQGGAAPLRPAADGAALPSCVRARRVKNVAATRATAHSAAMAEPAGRRRYERKDPTLTHESGAPGTARKTTKARATAKAGAASLRRSGRGSAPTAAATKATARCRAEVRGAAFESEANAARASSTKRPLEIDDRSLSGSLDGAGFACVARTASVP